MPIDGGGRILFCGGGGGRMFPCGGGGGMPDIGGRLGAGGGTPLGIRGGHINGGGGIIPDGGGGGRAFDGGAGGGGMVPIGGGGICGIGGIICIDIGAKDGTPCDA